MSVTRQYFERHRGISGLGAEFILAELANDDIDLLAERRKKNH